MRSETRRSVPRARCFGMWSNSRRLLMRRLRRLRGESGRVIASNSMGKRESIRYRGARVGPAAKSTTLNWIGLDLTQVHPSSHIYLLHAAAAPAQVCLDLF